MSSEAAQSRGRCAIAGTRHSRADAAYEQTRLKSKGARETDTTKANPARTDNNEGTGTKTAATPSQHARTRLAAPTHLPPRGRDSPRGAACSAASCAPSRRGRLHACVSAITGASERKSALHFHAHPCQQLLQPENKQECLFTSFLLPHFAHFLVFPTHSADPPPRPCWLLSQCREATCSSASASGHGELQRCNTPRLAGPLTSNAARLARKKNLWPRRFSSMRRELARAVRGAKPAGSGRKVHQGEDNARVSKKRPANESQAQEHTRNRDQARGPKGTECTRRNERQPEGNAKPRTAKKHKTRERAHDKITTRVV